MAEKHPPTSSPTNSHPHFGAAHSSSMARLALALLLAFPAAFAGAEPNATADALTTMARADRSGHSAERNLERGFLLCPDDAPDVREVLKGWREQGVRGRHIFPPSAAIVTYDVLTPPEWAPCELHQGPVEPSWVEHRSAKTRFPALAWNEEFDPSPVTPPAEHETQENPADRAPDSFLPPQPPSGEAMAGALPVPGFYETSEYMMGSIAIGVFLPESTGSAYDWTASEISQTLNGIYTGMGWFDTQAGSAANLSFVYELLVGIPTTHEPIQIDHGNEELWISEILGILGITTGDRFSRLRVFNNAIRIFHETDWAFSIFIVDSSPSVNQGRFPDGSYAWAYRGGPYISMSRYCTVAANWEDYFRAVPAHETGHIFYATDEYDTTVSLSGYLNSSDNNGAHCLMNQNSLALCNFTPLQMGWRDTDFDGIFDILDTQPETVLNAYSPDPAPAGNLDFTGLVTVTPFPNNNPIGTGRDVTLNTVTSAEYRIDGGSWNAAVAVDGAFDEAEEEITFQVDLPTAGTYLIEARAHNSVGNVDPTPASDQVTISGPASPASQIGAFRPTTRSFVMDADGSRGFTPGDSVSSYGIAGDLPLIGDWNGDGDDDIGVYRPSSRQFILDVDESLGWTPGVDQVAQYGITGDLPIIGDWNGDGDDDIGVFRPSSRQFVLDVDENLTWTPGVDIAPSYGGPGDLPIIGDWNGDGDDDIGAFRPSSRQFILDLDESLTWTPGVDIAPGYGAAGDLPIVGDWNGDGDDDIGAFRPSSRQFILDLDESLTWTPGVDIAPGYGAPGDLPIVGAW